MKKEKYIMSFTTGGLFHRESVKLAALYLELNDWNAAGEKVIAENLLQTRTVSTLKRVSREVLARLKTLNPGECQHLVGAGHQDQAYLLWISVCRRYSFIADFAVEVLHERYVSLKGDLKPEEFDSFFNRKAEWHPELEKITPSTRKKLRQVLFRILREADLVRPDNLINPAMPGPGLLKLIARAGRRELFYFPIFESDVKGMVK